MDLTSPWSTVWERRKNSENWSSTLRSLMELDGLDTGFGSVSEENWVAGVRESVQRLGLAPGNSVFEVGCGAGAFLYSLHQQGFEVAGLDGSATLVQHVSQAIPSGRFTCSDAAQLNVSEPYDAVISFSVFQYFTSTSYARQVMEAMVHKARRVVAILDLPDLTKKADAIAMRIEAAGGEEAYAKRYAGLDHQYYDPAWVAQALTDCGLTDVRVADQWIDGYDNSAFRFNAWGYLR